MLKLFTLLLTFLVFTSPVSAATSVKARIPSGIGILKIKKVPVGANSPIVIYKEPSLGRLAEIEAGSLPPLAQSIASSALSVPVIVSLKKSGWYRIIYDNGEREGWIEGRSGYQFIKWEDLLINRPVALISGLRKEFYTLHRDATASSEQIESVEKGELFTPLRVNGDWVLLMTDSGAQGWLRWRDDNGRLVISTAL